MNTHIEMIVVDKKANNKKKIKLNKKLYVTKS